MKRRRGQESNLPRLLRTDNGFEDREGHQAPFTLRKLQKANAECSTSDSESFRKETVRYRATVEDGRAQSQLFEFFDCADDGVEIRPVAGLEFGMEQFSIGLDFESAAT